MAKPPPVDLRIELIADNTCNLIGLALSGPDLMVPKTSRIVIVNHADGLHEGITDCRTNELKAS